MFDIIAHWGLLVMGHWVLAVLSGYFHIAILGVVFGGGGGRSGEAGRVKESLISISACFLAAIAKVSLLGGDWALGDVSTQI